MDCLQCLRRNANPDAHAHTHPDAHAHTHTDTDTDTNTDTNTDASARMRALDGRSILCRRPGGELSWCVVQGTGHAYRPRWRQLESEGLAYFVERRRYLYHPNAYTDADTDTNTNPNPDTNADTDTDTRPGQARADRLLAQFHQPERPHLSD
nr:hypothetical protein [Massilia sp. PAMC28688]